MPHFMIELIPYINLLNRSWIKKCPLLRNMVPVILMLFFAGVGGEVLFYFFLLNILRT